MANLTTYGANLVAKWLLTAAAATRPSAWYIGLGTGMDAAGITGEPSGNGYARQQVELDLTGGDGTTLVDEEFGPVTGSSWGLMSHIGLFDAASGGNCLMAGSLTAAKQMDVGDTLRFPAGDLDASFE